MNNLTYKLLVSEEVIDYFSLLKELFSELNSVDQLVEAVPKLIEKHNAQFLGVELGSKKLGFAQFHFEINLENHKICVIDELVVNSSSRSQGIGSGIINFINELAKKEGCDVIELGSNTKRYQAHKFYFKNGFVIDSFGFSAKVV